jgi:hypothetical protein
MEDSSMDSVDLVDATKFWDRSRPDHPSKRRDICRPIASKWVHAILKVSDVKRRFFNKWDSIVFAILLPALEQSAVFESYFTEYRELCEGVLQLWMWKD